MKGPDDIDREGVNRVTDSNAQVDARTELNEIPYAVNTTFVTDDMNDAVLTRVMRGPIVLNMLMVVAGILFVAMAMRINLVLNGNNWTSATSLEIIISVGMIIFGIIGLVSAIRYIVRSVNKATDQTVRRVSAFYRDRIVVKYTFDETVVSFENFYKMKTTRKLIILMFRDDRNSAEVFFVAKNGFWDQQQKKAVMTFFSNKRAVRNHARGIY